MTSGSSKGTQKKYYDNGYWYKENLTGSEGLAEELASEILKCSSLSNFVEYKQCKVNNRSGCRSQNFLQPDEMFLSFMPSSRTIEIVKHQIEIYYNIIPDFSNEQAEPHIK